MSVNKYVASQDLLLQIAGSGSEGSFHRTQAVQALAGATSVTITDSRIHATSLVTPFADNGTNEPIAWKTLTLSEGSCVITFDALEADTDFELVVLADSLSEDAYITDLKDVNISSVSNGQVLAYDGATGKWVNVNPSGGLMPHLVISADTGCTVTVTKGQTTITATETSTGVFECDVDDYGTWTISGELDGQEVEGELVVDTVAVYTYSFVPPVPDGATVMPINDIQTWIECAGLVSDCTTLAEVLEQEDLFDALLRDSNACKYMARSTEWAIQEGQVPTMTSNTTPSGVASASYANTNQEAYKAFDDNSSTVWGSYGTSNPNVNQWLCYEFPTATVIRSFELVALYDTNLRVKNFRIEGSNDGSTFDTLYTGATVSDSSSSATKRGYFKNNTEYKYYRLYVVDNWSSSSSTAIAVTSLQFYEDADITTNEDAMRRVGKYSYCKNLLMANEDWSEAILASDYYDDVLTDIIPVMTSNTTPEGEALCSSVYKGWSTYNYLGIDYYGGGWVSALNAIPSYVGYKFTSPKILKTVLLAYVVGGGGASSFGTKDFKVQGSNDGNNWNDLLSFTITTSTTNTQKRVDVNNDSAYQYYRIYTNDVIHSSSGNYYFAMGGLQMYCLSEEPSTNIIHSAPQDTIYYLDNSNNPVVLCTTDANGIGEVDWAEIPKGNFTIYSSVAKDPEDLSNDYPKNLIITNTAKGGTTEVYLMPDAIRTLYWIGYEDDELEDTTSANGWSFSNYTLEAPTHNTTSINMSCTNGKLSGVASKSKVNGTNAYAIATGVRTSSGYGYLNAENSKAMAFNSQTIMTSSSMTKYSVTLNNQYVCVEVDGAREINLHALWYARKKSANLVSASCDVVYYYDINHNKKILAITDGFGFAQVDFSALEVGTYTFYSSVAKDPSDLSQPFTKTVVISPRQATNLVMMPVDIDKMLYWWGYMSSKLEEASPTNGWNGSSSDYVSPTFNTRDITVYSSTNKVCGFASHDKVLLSKAHALVKKVGGGVFGITETIKADSDVWQYVNIANLSENVLTHVEKVPSDLTKQYYVGAWNYGTNGFITSALWYE